MVLLQFYHFKNLGIVFIKQTTPRRKLNSSALRNPFLIRNCLHVTMCTSLQLLTKAGVSSYAAAHDCVSTCVWLHVPMCAHRCGHMDPDRTAEIRKQTLHPVAPWNFRDRCKHRVQGRGGWERRPTAVCNFCRKWLLLSQSQAQTGSGVGHKLGGVHL